VCYVLYIGSDVPLPVGKFDSKHPSFYLSDIDDFYSTGDDRIARVRCFFTKKNIYYAGSHTNCGCGFFYNSYDEPSEYKDNKNSAILLKNTISAALEHSETVELLISWANKEDTQPVKVYEMTPEQLIQEAFPLDEFHFVTFRKELQNR
jgi:hypothetical protein